MKINYKDFSSSDYGVIISQLIESKLFPDIEKVLHDALHVAKFRRIRALWNKKVTEHETKYGKYKNRKIPKHLGTEYARFANYMDTLKKQLDHQVEIMNQMGIFKAKPEGESDGV